MKTCQNAKRTIAAIPALLLIFAWVSPAATVTLTWNPPTHNIDGTPLTDLAGYKLYLGHASQDYYSCQDIGVQTNATVPGLDSWRDHFFSVTVYNGQGVESDFSEEVVQHAAISNLLLSSHGGVLESFTSAYPGYEAFKLIDALHDGNHVWFSESYPGPQEFVFSFQEGRTARLASLVLYNAREAFACRDFELWASPDGETFNRVLEGSLGSGPDAQAFPLNEILATKLKLVVLSGYSGSFWELGEIEAYGDFADVPPRALIARTDASPTAADTAAFTITFNEPVTGFSAGDLEVVTAGGASAALGGFSGSGAAYAVTLTGLSGAGEAGIRIPAGACRDAADQPNLAADSVCYTVDRIAPVSGNVTGATNMSPVEIAYAGAADTGSGLKSVALWYKKEAGGSWTPSGLTRAAGEGVFAFDLPEGSGTYYFALRSEDRAGNRSPAPSGDGDLKRTYEEIVNLVLPANGGRLDGSSGCYPGYEAEHLTDTRTDSDRHVWWSQAYPGPQTFDFSFRSGRVARVYQAVLHNYRASFASRDFSVWASVDGEHYDFVTAGTLASGRGPQSFTLGETIAQSVRLEITGGYNPAFWELAEFEVYGALVDLPPECAIARTDASPTRADTVGFRFTFTEPVTGFTADDVTLVRDAGVAGTLGEFGGDGQRYTIQLTGVAGDGALGVMIPENCCYDRSGKTNLASACISYLIDNTAPRAGTITAVTNMGFVRACYTGAGDDGSGLAAVHLWYRKDAGAWTDSGLAASAGSGTFDFEPVEGSGVYRFALRAEDRAGNQSDPVSGSGDVRIFCPEIVNLILPAEGGTLESFTDAYPGYGPEHLTDRRSDTPQYVWWSQAHPGPQEFVYSFESNRMARLTEIVLYNCRASFAAREFEVWASTDDAHYDFVLAGTLEPGKGPQRFHAGGAIAKTVKLIITGGYSPVFWELAELEVFGYLVNLP
ncbi:MAG: fibronectin type III domain-containing protein, partial [Lentisphaerae bacterium]|nr:fibronectin type III domain-containing protein [Lentisphaerota bacterium]